MSNHAAPCLGLPLRRLASAAIVASTLAGCGGDDEIGGFSLVDDLPDVQALGAVWSFAPDDVWVTADGGRLLHFDGSSWTTTQLATNAMMMDAWGFSPDDLWLVGGTDLARYDGATWTVTSLSEEDPGIEDVVAIWGSAPDDVWVAGSQSTLAHFDGTTWQRQIGGDSFNEVLWGSGPADVYVSGTFEMARYDGSSWETFEPDWFSGAAEGIWGFGPDDVWLASGSSEMAHYDGSSWSSVELDFTAEGSALWGAAPSDLWAVGTPGGILHYDGVRWSEVGHQEIGAPYLRRFHDVHGSGQGDVWIVGTELGDAGASPQLYRR